MGGRSLEREVSLASGQRVCDALEALGYCVLALDVTRRPRRDAAQRAARRRLHRAARQVRRGRHDPGAARVPRHPVHRARAWSRARWRGTSRVAKHLFAEKGIPTPAVGHASPPTRSRRWARRPRSTSCPTRSAASRSCVKPAEQGSALGLHEGRRRRRRSPRRCSTRSSYGTAAIVEKWVEGSELAVSVLGAAEDARGAAAGRDRRRSPGSSTSRRCTRAARPTTSCPARLDRRGRATRRASSPRACTRCSAAAT